MSNKKPLTEAELLDLMENLSDIEVFSDDEDDGWEIPETVADENECSSEEETVEEEEEPVPESNNQNTDASEIVQQPVPNNNAAISSSNSVTVQPAKRKSKAAVQAYCQAHNLTYKDEITWRRSVKYVTPAINWHNPTPRNIISLGTPVSYFAKYFTDNMYNCMAEMTNLYAVQQNAKFSPTTVEELKTFVGINIMMGVLQYPRVRFYWDSRLSIPIIAENMAVNRFFKLRQNLHFVNNMEKDPNSTDRLWKVRPLYDAIRTRCHELDMETNLCVDEQMIPFKGQLNIKQYIKGKPCPWGIKLFALCGKSGMLYDFLLYQGATTEYNQEHVEMFGVGAAVVMKLSERIKEPNHQLYFDNYFSTYNLFQWLRNRHIYAAGTARIDRFKNPPFMTDKDMKKEKRGFQQETLSLDGDVMMTKWYDNKPVILASNFVSVGNVDNCKRWDRVNKKYVLIERPEVVQRYNNGMGGVDKLDFLITIYRTFIRSRKWTLRMVTHAIDLAYTNSWLEYRRDAQELGIATKNILDLIHFRAYIAEALIRSNKTYAKKRGRPRSSASPLCESSFLKRKAIENRPIEDVRYDGINHLPMFDDKKEASRCKLEGCKKKIHFMCSKCKVHLCICRERNCYKEFHTK